MAEDLRRSVEDLQSPVCGDCRMLMQWYRSIRMQDAPATIAHFFQCTNCGRVAETRTMVQPAGNSPSGTLSRPANLGHAA